MKEAVALAERRIHVRHPVVGPGMTRTTVIGVTPPTLGGR